MNDYTSITARRKDKGGIGTPHKRTSIDGISRLPNLNADEYRFVRHTTTIPVRARTIKPELQDRAMTLQVRSRRPHNVSSTASTVSKSTPENYLSKDVSQTVPKKTFFARRTVFGFSWSLFLRQRRQFALVTFGLIGFVLFSSWIVLDNSGRGSMQNSSSKVASWTTPYVTNNTVTNEQIMSYTVSSGAQPQRLSIPSVGIVARVISSSGFTPIINSNDVLWVKNSSLPGSSGVSLFIAYNNQDNFSAASILKPGDTIELIRGNGDVLRYVVRESVETSDAVNVETILQKKEMVTEVVIVILGNNSESISSTSRKQVISAILT